ncbi:MAG: biopolymer transporter ExbD [Verrucomicrobiota bacterium]|nr:biopolymer transporter ExbD [Verrucomicrobiota bacterium]
MRKKLDDPEVNMTPMIDVVFQLMIFFIVTIKLNEQVNEDIILEDAVHGPVIQDVQDPRLFIVEVDRRGAISIHGKTHGASQLRNILATRRKRYGSAEFPVLIRADYRAKHQDVRKVLDVCTDVGIWRLDFVAVKEHKATAGRHRGDKGGGMVRR